MKRNIKTMSVAAMAALAMVSCSNHDDFMSYEDFKAAEYEMAFVQKYGQIDPNHTWGFSNVATRAVTRAIAATHSFATAPNDADFKTEKDPNAVLITGYENGSNFYIDESINGNGKTIQPNGANIVLYVEGDVKPTDIYTPGGTTIYLLPGSKLTIPSNRASFGQNYTHIYIAKGAELIVQGGTAEFGYGVKVYNRGTITVDNITISNTGLVYNEGTIDIPGKIKVSNNNSELVNDGELTAANLGTEGSGHVQNNGTANIKNETIINSNNNTWVNNGKYTTEYFKYTAGSSDVINNCLLTVTEDFDINLGDNAGTSSFRMDTGSGVVTKNFNGGGKFDSFTGGPFNIYMGAGSVFKVTETATMNATKADYGIYGPETGDYAVFQAKTIVAGAANQGYEVTYGGNLAVVAESHFAQGYSGAYPYIDFKGNATIYENGDVPSITIEETECNPGFTGKNTTETPKKEPEDPEYNENGTPVSGRIFCEDLGSTGDFDFNDVVFDADIAKDNSTTIVLLAAGGIYDITVAGVHIHEVLGDGIVNTGVNEGLVKSHTITLSAAEATAMGISYAAGIGSIPVKVYATTDAGLFTEYELRNKVGGAPQKICVGKGTKWVKEYIDIVDAYPSFKSWVQNYQTPNTFTDGVESNLYQY